MQSANSIEFRKFDLRKLRFPRLIVHNIWAWVMCFFLYFESKFYVSIILIRCFSFFFLVSFRMWRISFKRFQFDHKNCVQFWFVVLVLWFFSSRFYVSLNSLFYRTIYRRNERKQNAWRKISNFYSKICQFEMTQPLRYLCKQVVHMQKNRTFWKMTVWISVSATNQWIFAINHDILSIVHGKFCHKKVCLLNGPF